MRICVSSRAPNRGAEVDPRFGRAAAFCIYDTESGETTCFENPPGASGGAGVQTAQSLVDQNIDAIVTNAVGPNAFRVLHAAGVTVYADVTGTVDSALRELESGALHPVDAPTNAGHIS